MRGIANTAFLQTIVILSGGMPSRSKSTPKSEGPFVERSGTRTGQSHVL